jgi:phosphatidylserine/phosphatidylglycerophosphate/cardiolipin synthase-like enzyme
MVRELGDAVKRGARVRVIMEPRVEDSRKQKVFDTLTALGVEVRWASMEYKLTHSKLVIVDGKKALLGSINFSKSALNDNREADAIIEGSGVSELNAVFEQDWAKASKALNADAAANKTG